ncbi:MAG: carboxypeptidase regulatory-like domain-containing protein [Gemmatimonadaceae bacterium]
MAIAGALVALLAAGADPLHAQALRGVVLEDSTLAPITAVEVSVLSGDSVVQTTRTDDEGRFTIALSVGGGYTLRARRIGYEAAEWPIELAAEQEMSLDIRLSRATEILPTMLALAPAGPAHYFLEAFERRRQMGLGGIFFTREDLEKRGLPRLPELLRGISGITVMAGGRRGGNPVSNRSTVARQCSAVLYMDGHRMHRSDEPVDVVRALYDAIPPNTLQAVEIYKGRSALPAEYGDPESRCGVVAVWTRRGSMRPASPRPTPPAPPPVTPRPTPPGAPLLH